MTDSSAPPTDIGTADTPSKERRRAPWRGRKVVPDAKGKFIAVRVTEADRERIRVLASETGLSIGGYLRATALGSAGPRAVKRPRVEREQLARLLGEIGKIGSNVNQIARRVNATRDTPNAPELDEIKLDIAAMRAALMQALDRGD